ncbi:MAG: hypothetical protein WC730_01285 [Patescibacteria group bacterium]|jgi:hypothetical protein
MSKRSQARQQSGHKGFITLTGILIIAAVSVTIVIAFFGLAVGGMNVATVFKHGEQARALAESCAEEALGQLRLSDAYAAGKIITFTHGSCQIVAIAGSGNTNRTLQVIGVVEGTTRRLEIEIAQISPIIQIISWTEVAIF